MSDKWTNNAFNTVFSSGGSSVTNTIYSADDTVGTGRVATLENTLAMSGGTTIYKGSGTTSATKSLVAKNNNDVETLQCYDDKSVRLGGIYIDGSDSTIKSINDGLNSITEIDDTIDIGSVTYYFRNSYASNTDLDSSILFDPTKYKIRTYTGTGNGLAIANDTTDFVKFTFDGTNTGMLVDDGGISSTDEVDATAIVQLNSSSRGFLPPKMTTTERTAMSTLEGQIVYDTTENKLYGYNGAWTILG